MPKRSAKPTIAEQLCFDLKPCTNYQFLSLLIREAPPEDVLPFKELAHEVNAIISGAAESLINNGTSSKFTGTDLYNRDAAMT